MVIIHPNANACNWEQNRRVDVYDNGFLQEIKAGNHDPANWLPLDNNRHCCRGDFLLVACLGVDDTGAVWNSLRIHFFISGMLVGRATFLVL